MKRHRYDATTVDGAASQIDQTTHVQQVTYPASTLTNATVYVGGVAGVTAGTTSLVILTNYQTAAGAAKTDGQILSQKGSKQFICQSVAGGVATKTRCTLVASDTIAESEMYIKAVAPDGTVFYASRITNRYVWNGTTRYAYVLGSTSAVTYIDSTSGVTFTPGGANAFAVVEGF